MPSMQNTDHMASSQEKANKKADKADNNVVDIEDPNASYLRRLYPDMGTEADEQWPVPEPEPDAPPLLDLDRAWDEVIAGRLITLPPGQEPPTELANTEASVEDANAAIITRELQYHILASTAKAKRLKEADGDVKVGERGKGEKGSNRPGTEEKEPGKAVAREEEQNGGDAEDVVASDDADGGAPRESIYGAALFLKLQWEDRKRQKKVPPRTYEELAVFISGITQNLKRAFQGNPPAAQKVVDEVALNMTLLLFARFMDGMETDTKALEESSYSLLSFCAERANPMEMHVAVKSVRSKIDTVYHEAVSYLILQPLIVLWGKVVSRKHRRRRQFLADLVKAFERMHPAAMSFENSFVPDSGGIGVEKKGRISRIPEIMLDFVESLIKKQILQRETDSTIALEVDSLGRETAGCIRVGPEEQKRYGEKFRLGHDGKGENKAYAKDTQDTMDWVCERAATLALLLKVLGILWTRQLAPTGEQRNVPKSHEKKRRQARMRKPGKLGVEEKEASIAKCVSLFKGLGWSNPALVCELATNGLCLERADRPGELMKVHIGADIRSKKEKKNTLFSVLDVAQYLCAALRSETRVRLSEMEQIENLDEYGVELDGTAFDLLHPSYAFDLVLPYLSIAIPQSVLSLSMAAITTIRAFLDRLDDGQFGSFDDILRFRMGSTCVGRDCSVLGLAYHIIKAVGSKEDPKHRRIVYETFQTLLRKCGNLQARFVLTEVMFYTAERPALAGELMKQMKDVLTHVDRESWDGKVFGGQVGQASQLRTRFAQNCYGRYFIPRKELLASMNPIGAAASLLYFLAVSDSRFLRKLGDSNEELRKEVVARMKFCKEYGWLGKECIRALAAVAEHDRKSLPTSKLAKKSAEDARAVYVASGRTLNQCVTALSLLESALQALCNE